MYAECYFKGCINATFRLMPAINYHIESPKAVDVYLHIVIYFASEASDLCAQGQKSEVLYGPSMGTSYLRSK